MGWTKHRQKNRSPIKDPPLRLPGESLFDRLLGVHHDFVMYFVQCALVWLVAANAWTYWSMKVPVTVGWCSFWTALAMGVTAFAILKTRRLWRTGHNLRQGMEGEVFVGQYLEEHCRERGYKVLHDIVADRFNVDHILIGPGGVFAIETKTISKPISRDAVVQFDGESVLVDGYVPDRDPIAQAYACARHVAELLAESTNRPVDKIHVRPVVLYPGWFIEGSSSGRRVWVLTPEAFVAFLDHEYEQLEDEDIGLYHSHLIKHIRAEERIAASAGK